MSKKIVIDLVYVREELADQRYDLTGYGPTVVDYDDALKAISNLEEALRTEIASLNIVHEKGSCQECDKFREYGYALTRVLGEDNLFGDNNNE